MPVGASLHVTAVDGAVVAATVVLVPGGALGVARAGALPEALPSTRRTGKPPLARVIVGATARRYPRASGATTLLLEHGAVSAGLLTIDAGTVVPVHRHAAETEALYVLEGSGTMTIDGVAIAVEASAVIQIPAGVPHGFTATTATRALQLYTPPGPEQRWKTMK